MDREVCVWVGGEGRRGCLGVNMKGRGDLGVHRKVGGGRFSVVRPVGVKFPKLSKSHFGWKHTLTIPWLTRQSLFLLPCSKFSFCLHYCQTCGGGVEANTWLCPPHTLFKVGAISPGSFSPLHTLCMYKVSECLAERRPKRQVLVGMVSSSTSALSMTSDICCVFVLPINLTKLWLIWHCKINTIYVHCIVREYKSEWVIVAKRQSAIFQLYHEESK